MNKHVLSFSDKINESIGVGSVLLIKGKQSSDGKYLYATTIQGHVEIKPGIKLVFIGDSIYRVINKGEDKFFGRKISHQSEEGLKGILNMKNPGKPSIVLNHNKTPFHWITLKHNDIGAALRELGPRLFSHDLILESDEEDIDADSIPDYNDPEVVVPVDNIEQRIESNKNYNESERNTKLFNAIMKEVLLSLTGKKSNVDIVNFNFEDEWDNEIGESEEGHDNFEWEIVLNVYIDINKFKEFEKEIVSNRIAGEFLDMLDVQDSIEISLYLESRISFTWNHDSGDHYTPSSSDLEVTDVEHNINEIYIDKLSNETIEELDDYNKFMVRNIEEELESQNKTQDDIHQHFKYSINKSKGINNDDINFKVWNIYNEYLKQLRYNRIMFKHYSQAYYNMNTSPYKKKFDELYSTNKQKIIEYWEKVTKKSNIDTRDLYNLQALKIKLQYLEDYENTTKRGVKKVSIDKTKDNLSNYIKGILNPNKDK